MSLEEWVAENVGRFGPDRPFQALSGAVLVMEWVDGDGVFWLTHVTSEGLPSWRVRGLLEETRVSLDRQAFGGGV